MSKQIQDAYIVAAVRTPVGKAPRGMFKNVRPDDMLAHVLKGAIAQVPGLDPHDIGDVIVGCAMPEGEQGMNVARIGVLLAGLPDSVPAMTINRFCSSGVQAIALAADRIRTGDDDVVIAAGTESMTHGADDGQQDRAEQRRLPRTTRTSRIAYGMGITAENVAKQWKVTREEQDAFAVASHQKACEGDRRRRHSGKRSFPTKSTTRSPNLASRARSCTARKLPTPTKARAPIRPLEAPRQAAHGIRRARQRHRGQQLADVRRRGGGDPDERARAEEIQHQAAGALRVLRRRGRAAGDHGHRPHQGDPEGAGAGRASSSDDLDWIELNEAFAAQALAVISELGLDPSARESAGRRDRAGPSARRHRRHPHGHAAARHAAQQADNTAW